MSERERERERKREREGGREGAREVGITGERESTTYTKKPSFCDWRTLVGFGLLGGLEWKN